MMITVVQMIFVPDNSITALEPDLTRPHGCPMPLFHAALPG